MGKTNSIIHLKPETKAEIYQKISEIEPFLPQGSAITVEVLPKVKNRKSTRVRIIATTPMGKVTTVGRASQLLDAVTDAKNLMLSELTEVHGFLPDMDLRSLKIHAILKNTQLH